jgi:hypothetical protein
MSTWVAGPLAAAISVLLLPAVAGAAPANDQYGSNLPTAKGQASGGTSLPQSHPEQLSPQVSKRLQGTSKGKELAAVATANQLGAPAPAVGTAGTSDDGDDQSFLSSAGDTLGDPLILGLIAVLAVGTIAAWRFGRRGGTT